MTDNAQPIRILRIITRLNVSGPTVHVILLTAYLREHGYDCHLLTGEALSLSDNMDYLARQNTIEPIIISGMDYSLNIIKTLKTLRQMYRMMRDLKPDVVHTHARTAGFFGRLAARLAGVPVIIHTFHEYPFHSYFSASETRLFIWIEWAMARLSDSIITLSESLRREIAEQHRITRKSRVTVLPLGFDLRPFTQIKRRHGEFRARWGIPADAPLVGIVGRLIPVKNHTLFLEAAAKVRQQIPETYFVVVGDGQLHERLKMRAKEMGLANRVIFTGWQQDVAPIYGDLDVNVISSISEGTPVPVIESLAAGCPVVATEVGGLPDLLNRGEFGRLVPSEDADALAQGIVETLQNPPDTKAAQQAMLDRYSIERLVKDLDSLYRGLLAKKKS